jgi:hypothetical protein
VLAVLNPGLKFNELTPVRLLVHQPHSKKFWNVTFHQQERHRLVDWSFTSGSRTKKNGFRVGKEGCRQADTAGEQSIQFTPIGRGSFPVDVKISPRLAGKLTRFFFAQKLNESCFEKCFVKPGSSTSGSEQTCITQCTDKYAEWIDRPVPER